MLLQPLGFYAEIQIFLGECMAHKRETFWEATDKTIKYFN